MKRIFCLLLVGVGVVGVSRVANAAASVNTTNVVPNLKVLTNATMGSAVITNAAAGNLLTLNGNSANTWLWQAKIGGTSYGGITNNGSWLLPDGTAANPAIGWASDFDGSGTGFYRSAANQIAVAINGSLVSRFLAAELNLVATSTLNWSQDTYLLRDGAANTLALRNGVNAQAFNIYNTYTDASNYERASIGWGDVANWFMIGTAKAGTGTARNLGFRTDGTTRWYITTAGHLLANADNTYDIGASGATRPRAVYAGPSGGFGSSATNTTVVVSATGATNTLGVNVILYVTAATGASLTDNAGVTEFSGVTIANFTPIRMQPGGKFVATGVTYATGTSSHAW